MNAAPATSTSRRSNQMAAQASFIQPLNVRVWAVGRQFGQHQPLPTHYGSRLECSGTYVFERAPDGSTIQRVSGRVKVHFPLVGGAVERAIVNGLKEHIQSEAAIVERWVQERKGTKP